MVMDKESCVEILTYREKGDYGYNYEVLIINGEKETIIYQGTSWEKANKHHEEFRKEIEMLQDRLSIKF